MARFYENNRNTPPPPPRPPRPMPPGDVTRRPQPQRPMSPPTPSGPRGGVSNEESERRIRDARNLMPMPRRSEPRPLPPGLEGQQYLAPGGMGGRMPPRRAPMPMPPGLEGQQYLAPGGMGGRMSGELDFLMSLLATPSRVARGAIEGGAQAVNPDFEMPDIEARLRAYMRQMQGGG